jgi:hypothetical protein
MARALVWLESPDDAAPVEVDLPVTVEKGPRTSLLRVSGIKEVSPDSSGNLLVDRLNAKNEEAFDAVHTFAVAQMTVTMIEEIIGGPIKWAWTAERRDPLELKPHAPAGSVTQYRRKSRSVTFSKPRPFRPRSDEVFQCRSFDIVAHEVGHAVLDGIHPEWMTDWRVFPEVGAVHESFADLTALFLALSRTELVDAAVAALAGGAGSNLVSMIGEAFGVADGEPAGERDLSKTLTMTEGRAATRLVPGFGVAVDHHHFSTVLSGLVYAALIDRFAADPGSASSTQAASVLRGTAASVRGIVYGAFVRASAQPPTIPGLVQEMVAAAERAADGVLSAALRTQAGLREIPLA